MLDSDEDLMSRVREDDQEAFNLLYRRYEARLRSLFVSFQCAFDDARDCVQDTFVRLWLSRSTYQPTGPFAAYLFTIARSCWIDRLRKLHCRPLEAPLGDGDDPGPEESPAGKTARAEWVPEANLMLEYRRWRVRRAVRSIPEPHRAAIEMVHLHGMKYAEAAQRLDVPIGTVKSRIATAVKMLRERLKEELL